MEHRRKIHVAPHAVDKAVEGAVGEQERREILASIRARVDEHDAKSALDARNQEIVTWCNEAFTLLSDARKLIKARRTFEEIDAELGLSAWVVSRSCTMTPKQIVEALSRARAGVAVTTYIVVGKMIDVSKSPAQVKRIFNQSRK